MKSFHFQLGNSTTGAIGFCARVKASDNVRAADLLRAALPDSVELIANGTPETEGIEYVEIYLNRGAVNIGDIDEVE